MGDVGWGSAEEVNLAQAGRNYGWPCYEGRSRVGGYSGFSTCTALYSKEGTSAGVTFPDYFYPHAGSGAAIVGGPTYTGGPYPDEFDGDLFFGDYVRGFIKRMEFDSAGRPAGTKDFATDWYGVDLELRGGELYYADFGDGSRGQGSVRADLLRAQQQIPDRGRRGDADLGRAAAHREAQRARVRATPREARSGTTGTSATGRPTAPRRTRRTRTPGRVSTTRGSR